MRQIRYFIEYILLSLGLFIIRRLSVQTSENIAEFFADFWYFINIRRRKLAVRNILQSRIAANPAEAAILAKESYRSFAKLIIETLKSDQIFNETNWRDHIELDIPAESEAIFHDSRQGVILVSGHLGNWEVASQLLSFVKPVVGISKKLSNPYSDRIMQKMKPKHHLHLTPMRDSNISRFLSVLKNGEVLAVMIDQHARGRNVMIDFFGKPAATHPLPALLHIVTGTPLVFAYCFRKGFLSFKFKCSAPIIHKPTGNKENDIKLILDKLTGELENAIREHPEQFLWAHRRWH